MYDIGIPAFYTQTGVGTWIESGEGPIKYKPWDGKKKKVEVYGDKREVPISC